MTLIDEYLHGREVPRSRLPAAERFLVYSVLDLKWADSAVDRKEAVRFVVVQEDSARIVTVRMTASVAVATARFCAEDPTRIDGIQMSYPAAEVAISHLASLACSGRNDKGDRDRWALVATHVGRRDLSAAKNVLAGIEVVPRSSRYISAVMDVLTRTDTTLRRDA
jgi:hypothetical protein